MDIDQLFEMTKLPLKSKQRLNIPKNAIYPHLGKTEDKELLQDNVQSIYLLAILNENTTNIAVYESETEYYNEIFFIHVSLRTMEKKDKIFNLLSRVFPYPVVIIFTYHEISTIYTGKYEKRLNSGVASVKVVSTYPSKEYSEKELVQLFSKMSLDQLTHKNLKELYLWIQENILGDTLSNKNNSDRKPVLLSADERDKINQLEKEIALLIREVRKENQINKRIPLQYELNEKKKQLKELTKRGE